MASDRGDLGADKTGDQLSDRPPVHHHVRIDGDDDLRIDTPHGMRDAAAFGQGHIVNARNVGLERIQKGDDVHKQKSKILLAVCADGSSAGRAAGALPRVRRW